MINVAAGKHWLDQTLIADLLEGVRPLIESSTAAGGSRSYGLTARERQVLSMVVAGHPNKDIARACSVSEQTIKHHLTRMLSKMGASNRVELAMLAARHGLVSAADATPTVDTAPAIPMASIPAMVSVQAKTP
jgi:DNA-binding NarL/FixJ family response regulator